MASSAPETAGAGAWLGVLRRYLLAAAGANLGWEFAHLPLYTIWTEGRAGEIVFAAVHCAAGDLLIATSALVLALIAFGRPDRPARGFAPVATDAILIGLGYTVFSEWLNTEIRRSWAYAELMPVLPFLGTGLSPLAQWIIIASAAFWWARRGAGARADRTAQPRTAVY